jgi:hypothetical protein
MHCGTKFEETLANFAETNLDSTKLILATTKYIQNCEDIFPVTETIALVAGR